MSSIILAQEMVRISVPRLVRWVESSCSPIWLDNFSLLLPVEKISSHKLLWLQTFYLFYNKIIWRFATCIIIFKSALKFLIIFIYQNVLLLYSLDDVCLCVKRRIMSIIMFRKKQSCEEDNLHRSDFSLHASFSFRNPQPLCYWI